MNEKQLKNLKQDYNNIPIPAELSQRVQAAIAKEAEEHSIVQKPRRIWRGALLSAAAACLLFVGTVNLSPAAHTALAGVPGLGTLVEVCTFRDYTMNDGNYQANVQVPQISGVDEEVAAILNDKYLAEGRSLYEAFVAETDALKADGVEGHMGIDSGYDIKTNNDDVFAIARYVQNTVGSSSTTWQFDTIDRKNQLIVTLPSLFSDNADYITPVSAEIKKQMAERMAADENVIYWLNDETMGDGNFDAIKADQNFYINADGKLVICFDKYEVAPGYMGDSEFIIPTEVLDGILLNRGLIK